MRNLWTTERKIIGGFGISLVVLIVVASISVWLTLNLLADLKVVQDQNETLQLIAETNALMPQMTTSARLYALGRSESHFLEYEKIEREFAAKLDEIEMRTRGSAPQRERLNIIREVLRQKVGDTRRDSSRESLEATWGIVNGISQIRPMSDALMEIGHEERSYLGRRNSEAQPKALAALLTIGLASGLALMLVGGAVTVIMRDLRKREQAAAELVRAREAAEAASVAKSVFLANMSHELRTPLTSIMGYADLLLEPQASASRREEFLQTLRRSGEHLLMLINDILDVSKIEAGRMTEEVVECSIIDIMADLDSLMRSRAVDKGLQFNVEYTTPMPETVMTDPTRFRQIVTNIVGNALKFTDEGSVRVLVSYKRASGADAAGGG